MERDVVEMLRDPALDHDCLHRLRAANEIERLRTAIQQTLDENGHLADGDICTLILLKRALEVPNALAQGPGGFSPGPAGATGSAAAGPEKGD